MSTYIRIERDRTARSAGEGGARFRVVAFAQLGGPPLLSSTRHCGSVRKAKVAAEAIFGPLQWRDSDQSDPPEVRAAAVVERGIDANS